MSTPTKRLYPSIRHLGPVYERNSSLRLSQGGLGLEVRIRSTLSRKTRRTILLSLFKHLKLKFKEINLWSITHSDAPLSSFLKAFDHRTKGADALHTRNEIEWIGFQLRLERTKLNLTQKQFAEYMGISRGHLSKLEHGKLALTSSAKHQVLKALSSAEKAITQPALQRLPSSDGG